MNDAFERRFPVGFDGSTDREAIDKLATILRAFAWATRVTVACAIVAALLFSLIFVMDFREKSAAAATCTDSLQAKIDAAPAGGTVEADPCIYREQITITKPITLVGQPGTEIRGSEVWSDFFQRDDGLWVSANVVPDFPSAHGECDPSSGRCLRPEQVFMNGQPLRQIGRHGMPKPGMFALDHSNHVVLADDPSGQLVEVSVRRIWVDGMAPDVTIENFTMKHAANDSQWRAALVNHDHANWTLKNVDLSYAHGANVSLTRATGLRIEDSEIHHAGQVGINASDGALSVENTYLHDNNLEAFDPGWHAGGLKAVRMSSLTVKNSEVTRSDQGLWCDLNCTNVVFSNNRVHHNDWSGIIFEVSTGAEIAYNKVYENGWGKTGSDVGSWQAAIHISLSRDANVHDNVVAWNRSGISIVRYERGEDPAWENVYGNHVHDNTILSVDYPSSESYNSGSRSHALAFIDQWTKEMYLPEQDNRAWNNAYYYPAPTEDPTIPRYYWGTAMSSLGAFNVTPGEEDGRYLTQSEKVALVANNDIPAYPQLATRVCESP